MKHIKLHKNQYEVIKYNYLNNLNNQPKNRKITRIFKRKLRILKNICNMKQIKIEIPFCKVDYAMKIIWNDNSIPQHKFKKSLNPIVEDLKIITKNIKYGLDN